MHVLLAIIVLAFCAWLLQHAVRDIQANSWAGPRTPGMRSRAAAPSARRPGRAGGIIRSAGTAAGSAAHAIAHPSNGQIRAQAKADAHRLWQEAYAKDWLAEQDHIRKNGAAGTSTATVAAPPRTIRQRLFAPFTPKPPDSASGGANGNSNGAGPQAPPAPAGHAPASGTPPASPAAPPPRQPPASSTNGGTPVPTGTSTAASEKLIEGIQEIYAHAASGGINAKQEAVRAAREAAVRFAGMMQMLARTMAEPGSNYGPEVTEPIAKAGQHFQAGSMTLSEADNALETLANMTLREASASPRQVPHHEHELSEAGRH